MVESANHIPAPMEKDIADGLSPTVGSSVAAPMPIPSKLSRIWVTSATTTPARTARSRFQGLRAAYAILVASAIEIVLAILNPHPLAPRILSQCEQLILHDSGTQSSRPRENTFDDTRENFSEVVLYGRAIPFLKIEPFIVIGKILRKILQFGRELGGQEFEGVVEWVWNEAVRNKLHPVAHE